MRSSPPHPRASYFFFVLAGEAPPHIYENQNSVFWQIAQVISRKTDFEGAFSQAYINFLSSSN